MPTPYATYGAQGWRSEPGGGGPDETTDGPWRLPHGGRPLCIAIMILGFLAWWPIGLAVLFYLIGSGRMGCGTRRRRDAVANNAWAGRAPGGSGPWAEWKRFCGDERAAPSSGNHAFDEYRADTLRRLEEEQREFAAFLERLRFAKDKAELDAFMTERRQAPPPPAEPPPG